MAYQTKSYKKFVATAATATLVASAVAPVASAAFTDVSDRYTEAVNYLVEKGITSGTSASTFGTSAEITRGQAAIMLVKALGLNTAAAADKGFTDVPAEYKGYANALAAAGITSGKTATTFGWNDKFTRNQAAVMFAKAYNLTGSGSVAFTDVAAQYVPYVSALVEAGLTSGFSATKFGATSNVTRGQFAIFVHKAATMTPVEEVVAKVESVTAANLKEVTVTFNTVLDSDTAEDTANYSLSAGTVSSASLDESGKVVTLTLTAAAAQQDEVDVTVEDGVTSDSGQAITETTKTVTFFDQVVPAAQQVEVTGPKTVRVHFSEPINSASITDVTNFTVDGNTYSVSSVTGTVGNYYVDITLGTELPEGSHTLKVNAQGNATNALKDFAGFYVPTTTLAYEYKRDTTAPVASISKSSQNSVTIKFNKDIDAATQSYLSVYHTYNNVSGYVGSISWTDNKTAVVTFSTNYLPVGNVTVYLNTGSGSNVVKDNWANSFVSTTLTTSISSDTTAPTVSTVKVVDSTHIDVTFSEEVTGGTTAANYTLKDSAGDAVTVTSVADQTNNTYRLTTATLVGGSYSLSIKGIKDTSVSENALADYSTALSINDLVKPTVTSSGVYSTDDKKVVINFNEAMATTGTGSVLNKANYQVALDGSTYADLSTFTGSSITLGADGKSVIIDFGTAKAFVDGTSKVRVGRVADVAGNVTADFTTDVLLAEDDVTISNISNVKAIAQNKVQFKLNTALKSIDVSKFNIETGADHTATAATYVNDGNTSIVTVTIADANKFDTDLNDLVNVEFTAGALTTALGTSNGATVTQAITAATADYVGPVVSTITTNDDNTNGKIDQVIVTFSEDVYVASVQEADFTVEGYEITGVAVASGTVTLSVKEKSTVDSGVTPKVTLVGSISDDTAQRNSVGNLTATTADDGVALIATLPTVTGASTNDVDTIVVTFSEELYINGTAVVNGADVETAFTAFGTGTITTAIYNKANKTVTFTVASAANTDTITHNVGATALTDAAGNAYAAKVYTYDAAGTLWSSN